MKIRHAMISLVMAMAAGCDTMEQDVDGKTLSINNDPAYFLPNNDGFIDLSARILSPGKIRVEITGTTRNGELKDLGKGLLQYSPFKNSRGGDSFNFRVFSGDNKLLGEDSIGIVIPKDTTQLPCNYVYTRTDTAHVINGPVTVDVAANDYSCSGNLTVSVNLAPLHGTISIIGTNITFDPDPTFAGYDMMVYKAVASDPSVLPGYGILYLLGSDSLSCRSVANEDLFYKPKNDTAAIALDVLANDNVCDSIPNVSVTVNPRHGYAYYDKNARKIWYKNTANVNLDDSLKYILCGATSGGCYSTQVIIKRN